MNAEKLLDKVVTDEEILKKSLFSSEPKAEVLLAYINEDPAGFAIYYYNFSSFLGRPGIYIEDIFVREANRKQGIGRKLFRKIAAIAHEKNCGRMEWAVLDWNKPAINFYKRLGAKSLDEWTTFRLSEEMIKKVALS